MQKSPLAFPVTHRSTYATTKRAPMPAPAAGFGRHWIGQHARAAAETAVRRLGRPPQPALIPTSAAAPSEPQTTNRRGKFSLGDRSESYVSLSSLSYLTPPHRLSTIVHHAIHCIIVSSIVSSSLKVSSSHRLITVSSSSHHLMVPSSHRPIVPSSQLWFHRPIAPSSHVSSSASSHHCLIIIIVSSSRCHHRIVSSTPYHDGLVSSAAARGGWRGRLGNGWEVAAVAAGGSTL